MPAPLMVTVAVALGATALLGCGGSGEAPTTTSSSAPSTSTTIVPPTVPAGSAPVCDLLAETLGPDELVPRRSDSWRDERERVLVDAQREAGLLRRAATIAPTELVEPLDELAAHAEGVAAALAASSDLDDARAQLVALDDADAVRAAADAVAAWQDANC